MGIFEPLGKDLHCIIHNMGAIPGFKIEVIKRIAKDILNALKTLHGECGMVHTDIKPHNIATTISKKSLRRQFEEIVHPNTNLDSIRMSVKQSKKSSFDAQNSKRTLKKWLKDLPPLEDGQPEDLKFKLIDFGNAVVSFL